MNYRELQCNGHSVKLILENYKYKSVLTAHVHDLCHTCLHYITWKGPITVTLWNKHVKLRAKPSAEHLASEPHHYSFIAIKFWVSSAWHVGPKEADVHFLQSHIAVSTRFLSRRFIREQADGLEEWTWKSVLQVSRRRKNWVDEDGWCNYLSGYPAPRKLGVADFICCQRNPLQLWWTSYGD